MANDRKIIRLEVTESTNSVALELGEKGASDGTVVVSSAQTGGRGRLNRPWLSLPGMGLYFSIILRPDLPPEHLPKVTLAAGLAICKTVETEYALQPKIKWPNDLLINGQKFGGILTESGSVTNLASEQKPLVVIGVGLNLFPPDGGFPTELKELATSLSLHIDQEISAEKLLERCASAIEEVLQRMERGDFPAILEEWKQRDASKDKILTWVTPQGMEVTGISLGPDADGVLRIKDRAGETHTVISGDVSLAAKYIKNH